jgi:hypothetical protein
VGLRNKLKKLEREAEGEMLVIPQRDGAIRNSTDPKWARSFFVASDPDEWVKPIPDLSE